MRLVYLPSADDDILDIFVTIALDSEPAAHRFVDRLRTAILRLADYPESAPARDDIAPGMRARFRALSGAVSDQWRQGGDCPCSAWDAGFAE